MTDKHSDAELLRLLLPGLDSLLALNGDEAAQMFAKRPDVWLIIRAFLAQVTR